jgi:hypothetical protein
MPIDWKQLETVPAAQWLDRLDPVAGDTLLPAIGEVIRVVLLPRWVVAHPDNRQPMRALDAVSACINHPSDNNRHHALAIAKALTKERRNTLGYGHLTIEAVRAVVWAATHRSTSAKREALAEALGRIEEELRYRDSLEAIYGRERYHRAEIIEAFRAALEARRSGPPVRNERDDIARWEWEGGAPRAAEADEPTNKTSAVDALGRTAISSRIH